MVMEVEDGVIGRFCMEATLCLVGVVYYIVERELGKRDYDW